MKKILSGKRILLIEDQVFVSTMYRDYLAANGAEVTVAPNGDMGLNFMKEHAFDVVLLDRILDEHLDGFAVLEKMRADERTKETPVIFLTNLNLEENEKEFIANNKVAGYYVKADIPLDVLAQILSTTK